jgi:alpha-1,6-mannosyltransferase
VPIKTLHLTNYWHERSGGIATFYRHLMEAANLHQRRMVLIVPGERNEVIETGPYSRIYKIAAPPSPFNPEYRTIYPREFSYPGSKIQRIFAEEQPDLVEFCDKYSLLHLGSLLRFHMLRDIDFRPVVVGLTCERMDENFATYASRAWWAPMFSHLYMRHIYFPAFDHHIAVSERTADELKAVAKGHLVRRGVWIRPMGVDVEHFTPSKRSPELREQLCHRFDIPENAKLLLYAGRVVPEKNLDLLVDTMAELTNAKQDFRLIIAGDGISRDEFEQKAKSRVPGKINFIGHLSDREELARLYASCDAFIHPNPAEPFGIAPLEAMASGLPLIAPDRGGITAYANSANSYLAPPTAEAFAQLILAACQAGREKDEKIRSARKTAEQYAWPRVTESFLRLYDDLYRAAKSKQSIEAIRPAFISSPAPAVYAGGLRSASTFARTMFLGYTGVCHLFDTALKRTNNPASLKDMQLQ